MNTPSGPLALGRAGSHPRHQEQHATRARDSEGGPHSNKTISMLTARGEAHSAGNECLSAHSLAWVDPETGEHLELELRCDEGFRNGLESIGFERVNPRPRNTRT